MDLRLKDKIVLLVGGTGTIGQAVFRAFACEGARCVVADLPSRLENNSAGFPETIPMDVTSVESVSSGIENIIDTHGRIDVLVTLAGVYQGTPIVKIDPKEWDRLLAVNLKGTFLPCREVLPHMQTAGSGRIICIASLAGQVGGVVAGADYAASKAGVLSFVKSLAKQTNHPGITVNAVSPGPVEGTMTGAWPEEDRRSMAEKIPMRRFAKPEEIADLILFLSSPRAGYIHGARIDVNGGVFMG